MELLGSDGKQSPACVCVRYAGGLTGNRRKESQARGIQGLIELLETWCLQAAVE